MRHGHKMITGCWEKGAVGGRRVATNLTNLQFGKNAVSAEWHTVCLESR